MSILALNKTTRNEIMSDQANFYATQEICACQLDALRMLRRLLADANAAMDMIPKSSSDLEMEEDLSR